MPNWVKIYKAGKKLVDMSAGQGVKVEDEVSTFLCIDHRNTLCSLKSETTVVVVSVQFDMGNNASDGEKK